MGVTKNLVLGGSGLVGAPLCRYLESLGEEVINIDLKNGDQYDIRTMDLDEYKDVDFVWFLAWEVGGAKFLHAKENLYNILENNTILCQKVFAFVKRNNLPFLFASTQMADANNTYGITKLLGEEWARLLDGKIARFWNVYGWEVPGERSHVIPDLVVKGLDTGVINLMTDGKERRQFVHVDDCARNLVRTRDSDAKDVDLTSGNWISIGEIAEMIAERTGARVVPGEAQGFENVLEATKIPDNFRFDVSLEMGLDGIVAEGKKYLKLTT